MSNPGDDGMSDKTGQAAALARLQSYLQQDPDNWNLRAEIFDAALAAGEAEIAQSQMEYALRMRPADAAWQHRQAMALLAKGRYVDAQVILEALIARGIDNPGVRHNLGYALFAQGRFEAARDVVSPLLEGPADIRDSALVLWLRCQHRLVQLDEALGVFARYAGQRSLPADAWGAASLIALDAERVDDARAWSERALSGRADQLEALAAGGSVALGDLDVRAALDRFERAVRVNPGDGRSWSGLAFARMLERNFGAALEAFRKAVAGMPDHVGTWIGFGWCQFLANEPAAARGAFEQALLLDRNFAESHGALAVALVHLGDTDRAKNEIELAFRLDPRCLSAQYARAMLSGETNDPAAFLRLARRAVGQRPGLGDGRLDQILASMATKGRK
jgi:tetratricopeptide (TPR) repeat protein